MYGIFLYQSSFPISQHQEQPSGRLLFYLSGALSKKFRQRASLVLLFFNTDNVAVQQRGSVTKKSLHSSAFFPEGKNIFHFPLLLLCPYTSSLFSCTWKRLKKRRKIVLIATKINITQEFIHFFLFASENFSYDIIAHTFLHSCRYFLVSSFFLLFTIFL